MRALSASEHVRIVAVTEPAESIRAGLIADGCTVHADLDEMLRQGGLDGALIAVPSDRHLAVVAQVAAAGLPILCEKPCGITPEQAQHAANIAARHSIPLQVAYWRRFVPELRRLKGRITAGELGQLYFVACHQWDELAPAAEFRAHSGGIFVDMGVHEFDQIRWLTGQDITQIRTSIAATTAEPPVPGDAESAAALCDLTQGSTALVSLGRRHAPGDICRVEVFGTHGAAEARFLGPPDGTDVFMQALRLQSEGFAFWARGGVAEGATAADAVAALQAAGLASRDLRPSR